MRTHHVSSGRAGFTLVELLIAMTVGLVVLAAATGLVASTWRGMSGNREREGIERNARFINEALMRDLSETGVGISSSVRFGTLSARGDTIVILSVPYTNNVPASPHTIQYAGPALAPATGTCGTYCIDVDTVGFDIAIGDLALLQSSNERRLIQVTNVTRAGGKASVTFSPDSTLLQHEGAYARNLQLSSTSTVIMKLKFVEYYVQNQRLMRAERLNADRTPAGELIATGVDSIKVNLVFTNGNLAPTADPTDASGENDWNDIMATRVFATLQSDPTDTRLRGGLPVTRNYQWWFAPRNLKYEKNRVS